MIGLPFVPVGVYEGISKMHEDRESSVSSTSVMNNESKSGQESLFLNAVNLKKTEKVPIWLMRQAGRFMPEYREIRARMGFKELCKSPTTAAEVTIMAVEKLNVDAAIIFADILLLLEPMGIGLSYARGDGPVIANPVRTVDDINALRRVHAWHDMGYVMESIKHAIAGLKPNIPLIGFAGAPFTLASYAIEGGSSRNFEHTKQLMYNQPDAWKMLMEKLADATSDYLNAQIDAGAKVVQIFDSWVGSLGPSDYREYVLPYMKRTISGIKPGTPVIHFGTGTSALLELMKQAGGNVIGVDWRIDLDVAWARLGYDVGIQGNLDPCVLLADKDVIKRRALDVLKRAENRPGFIFNLGHGVLPQIPFDNVKYLVEVVHEYNAT